LPSTFFNNTGDLESIRGRYNLYSKSLPAKQPREDFARKANPNSENYGVGEEVVVVVVSVVLLPVVGAGVGMVVVVVVLVLASVEVAGEAAVSAGEAAGTTVSDFCSHAARSAALARMQMYFFISFWIEGP
jgi:hypothetical protein